MDKRYGRRWGTTRLERARRIKRGPVPIRQVPDGYIVPSQRFPYMEQYHVYTTANGPRCGSDVNYDNGCADKLYRHGTVDNCKHELAVSISFPTRRSRRLAQLPAPVPAPRAVPAPLSRARVVAMPSPSRTRRARTVAAYEKRQSQRIAQRTRRRSERIRQMKKTH